MSKYIKFLFLAVVLISAMLMAGCSSSATGEKYIGDWHREAVEPSLGRPAIEHMLIAKQGNGYTVTISFETYEANDSNNRTSLSWQTGLFKTTLPAELKSDVLSFKSGNSTKAIILNDKDKTIQVDNKVYTKDQSKINTAKVKEKAKKFLIEYGKDAFIRFSFSD